MNEFSCSGSAIRTHDADAKGNCRWCGRQGIDRPAPRPERFPVSDLTEAYGYFCDPDYDGDPR